MSGYVTTHEDQDGVELRWVGTRSVITRTPGVAAKPRRLFGGAAMVALGLASLCTPIVLYGAPLGTTVVTGDPLFVPATVGLLVLVLLGLASLLMGFILVVTGSKRHAVTSEQTERVRGSLRIDHHGVWVGGRRVPWHAVDSMVCPPGERRLVLSLEDETLTLLDGLSLEVLDAAAREIERRKPELAPLDEEGLSAVRKLGRKPERA